MDEYNATKKTKLVLDGEQNKNIINECILFTGTLNSYTRSEDQQLVFAAGGRVLNYCSSAVTLLVVGVIDNGLFEPPTTHKLT
ncbi:BRCT domain-containing protein [Lactiplantibacillus plantarum]|uniref:BRCT domain-containing protein n=1 Tax=Lactiplantibacillus plantarum TaxID=1590 RepID=UPI0007B559F3|nr:BRCT domain-containing protein [Lactiplantibacillus plantarum]GFF01386.1 hypothetical protein DmLsi_31890 [Lactiplantibacillus plantarum]